MSSRGPRSIAWTTQPGRHRPTRGLPYLSAVSAGRLTPGALISRFAGRLRYPTVFLLMGAVFLLDLLIPDALPFADEILLGLATVFLGALRAKDAPRDEPGEPTDAHARRDEPGEAD